MADPPSYPDTDNHTDTDVEPDRGSTGAPLWVWVFGIVAVGMVMLFVVLHLTGGGLGPGAHTP